MSELSDVVWAILIFSFGLFTLFAGLFTAYFGAGKSRAIGFVLTIIGLVFLLGFVTLTWSVIPGVIDPVFMQSQKAVVHGLAGVLASAVGAVAALIVFLISIMKA